MKRRTDKWVTCPGDIMCLSHGLENIVYFVVSRVEAKNTMLMNDRGVIVASDIWYTRYDIEGE